MLKLKKFQVTDFRSVRDSGWIETDSVTALIGVNESGKTNLLLPLWKLKPANEGKIDPIADYPRVEYNKFRDEDQSRVFIRAEFETDKVFIDELVKLTGLSRDSFSEVHFERCFDGKWHITFPKASVPRSVSGTTLLDALGKAGADIESDASEPIQQGALLGAIKAAREIVSHGGEQVNDSQARQMLAKLKEAPVTDADSASGKRWADLLSEAEKRVEALGLKHPDREEKARMAALKFLPSFVYYSNYGNLDSEIYLPHVIQNLKRDDLGTKEAAKARTLRVLFKFVGLEPQEILDLGKAAATAGKNPTDAEIAEAAERTKERSVLLQSASTKLTKEFKNWWKQGDYRFRFEADGDHFRIWVSDDLRPEEIELEARSTGLQWFLSFFLVFLVESEDAHEGAILLLDEPGLSLHPLAQKDLSVFFDGLADTNQLLFTTHSPFLVDPDRLDQVRAVYTNPTGATVVSTDLRAGKPASPEFKSVYAVHAALGLSISDALLQGCTNVIVEGPSDQSYMSGIKSALIALGKIKPQRELLFIPGGGAKGVSAFVPIFAGKDEAPPHVVLDSDSQGKEFAKKLREGTLYRAATERIRAVGDLLGSFDNAEVEDLIPLDLMIEVVGKLFRGDEDFGDSAKDDAPIVPQIEAYAKNNGIALEPGWKVDLARAVKQRILRAPEDVPEATISLWVKLFEPFSTPGDGTKKAKRSSKG